MEKISTGGYINNKPITVWAIALFVYLILAYNISRKNNNTNDQLIEILDKDISKIDFSKNIEKFLNTVKDKNKNIYINWNQINFVNDEDWNTKTIIINTRAESYELNENEWENIALSKTLILEKGEDGRNITWAGARSSSEDWSYASRLKNTTWNTQEEPYDKIIIEKSHKNILNKLWL